MLASLVALALLSTPLPHLESTPETTAAAFVDAFKKMDEARFDRFFDPDVTMFFPDGPFPHGTVEGRDAVLSTFHAFFKLAKGKGRSLLNITPIGQRVQRYGDIAIVTFRLDQEGAVGRRSLILRKSENEWRIVHFHASTID